LDKIERLINKYKADDNYANLTEEELRKIAENYLARKLERRNKRLRAKGLQEINGEKEEKRETTEKPMVETDLDVSNLFTDKEEQKLAGELLRKYLADYSIETISDKNTLRQLIYLEAFQSRLQRAANEFDTTNGAAPIDLMEAIHKNLNQIVSLKEKLGLTKKGEHVDGLKQIELLQKKFKRWREENGPMKTMTCPHCGKLTRLVLNMDSLEAIKHPFWKDRVLGNEHLVRLFKAGVLTKEDIANIFNVSNDYAEILVSKWLIK
jgi:hypothetical protein